MQFNVITKKGKKNTQKEAEKKNTDNRGSVVQIACTTPPIRCFLLKKKNPNPSMKQREKKYTTRETAERWDEGTLKGQDQKAKAVGELVEARPDISPQSSLGVHEMVVTVVANSCSAIHQAAGRGRMPSTHDHDLSGKHGLLASS